jgi:hypothetical protein
MLKKARILVVFAALFAAACVPETETFLSSPGAQPLDGRMIGTWYWLQNDGREVIVLTVRRGGDKRFNVIWTVLKPRRTHVADDDPPVQFVRYKAHTTRLGKATFINLTLVDRKAWKDNMPQSLIMRYWIDKRGLRIALMKNDVIRKAVKEGRLAGVFRRNNVVITAKRDALIAFLRKTGFDKSFEKPTARMPRMRPTGS